MLKFLRMILDPLGNNTDCICLSHRQRSASLEYRVLNKYFKMAATTRRAIIWLKYNDLRLADHEPIVHAHANFDSVLHLFVFDPIWHGKTAHGGLPRLGHFRAKFLLETVSDLRASLKSLGSDLIVRCGDSATVLAAVARATSATAVLTHREVCVEELELEQRVSAALKELPAMPRLITFWGGQTLYHMDDIGIDIAKALPPVFSNFRRHVEGRASIRGPLPAPLALKPSPPSFTDGLPIDPPLLSPFATVRACGANAGNGLFPSLAALGVPDLSPHYAVLGLVAPVPVSPPVGAASSTTLGDDSAVSPSATAPLASAVLSPAAGTLADGSAVSALPSLADPRCVMRFSGGEKAALARLAAFVWGPGDALRTYKATRNGLLGADYSSKLAPWLAVGAISPRTIAAEVRAYEAARGGNDSTYWLLFELLWRDYFRFAPLAWGRSLFSRWGPRGARAKPPSDRIHWLTDRRLLTAWASGSTGYPFVDASMIELLRSGFSSNRSRQNVASFFVRDLGMDWRLGAEWFESLLLDYDPGSNYGNWTYVAGVGADPREDRYFLIPKQARDYDPHGHFCTIWLPQLKGVPADALHDPRRLTAAQRGAAAYPAPVVPLFAWSSSGSGNYGGGDGGRGGSNSSRSNGGGGGTPGSHRVGGTSTSGGGSGGAGGGPGSRNANSGDGGRGGGPRGGGRGGARGGVSGSSSGGSNNGGARGGVSGSSSGGSNNRGARGGASTNNSRAGQDRPANSAPAAPK